jgi:hypothetical protein
MGGNRWCLCTEIDKSDELLWCSLCHVTRFEVLFIVQFFWVLRPVEFCFFSVALLPNAEHGLLILEVSKSHSDVPKSVGIFWKSYQLVAKTSTLQRTTLITDWYPCLRRGFETTVSAGERPQTYALDCEATGTGRFVNSYQHFESSWCFCLQGQADVVNVYR